MAYLSDELIKELEGICDGIIKPGHGILDAGENSDSMKKEFQSIGVENTEENRRQYRELLVTSDKKWGQFIGGVIISHETLYQKSHDGTPFIKHIKDCGISTGIRIDTGLVHLPGTENETTSQGLDNLAERCKQYKSDGCVFTAWKCRLQISKTTPSQFAIEEVANVMARFASISQSNNLVPLIVPEILPDGDHDIAKSLRVTEMVLSSCFKALLCHHVCLEGIMLAVNPVAPGLTSPQGETDKEVAMATVTALRRTVPAAVKGVTFLSGGQSETSATAHLSAINKVDALRPWALSFSYGRALQASVLKAWQGKPANVAAAQKVFLHRARMNSLASVGKYVTSLEEEQNDPGFVFNNRF